MTVANPCTSPGCDRHRHARGLCSAHYKRALAGSRPDRREQQRAEMDARVEDLCFLLDVGTPVPDAVRRVGWTVQGAARGLAKRGLHQYAQLIERDARWSVRAA